MERIDCEFWINLVKLQNLNKKIKEALQYGTLEGVPMDLNDIAPGTEGEKQLESFEHFATNLEGQALEFSEIAEKVTTYTAQMRVNFDERENELLPDEDFPGTRVGE